MSDITPEEAQPDEFPDAPVFAVDINANEPPLDSEEFARPKPKTKMKQTPKAKPMMPTSPKKPMMPNPSPRPPK